MRTNAYLTFAGNCREAMEFYASLAGGKIVQMMTHGEMPPSEHTPPEWKDKILHSEITFAGGTLMGSDAPPNWYEEPRGFSVSVTLDDVKEGERIFRALSENARRISLPFSPTFWSPGFGMCTDRFGTPWIINCTPPAG